VIEKFGTDALRFGIAYLTTETQDVRMPVEFECPHCNALVGQTKKNRQLPRIECTKCGKPFSTQWATRPEDVALPRAAVVSERFELGRNFANKLWNAARFTLMNLEGYEPAPLSDGELTVEDRWLLSRLATVTQETTDALQSYRFAEAARALYDFAWEEFCSFFVEMSKPRLADAASRPFVQRVLAHALDTLMRLLHPMIPFLTEEVWQRLREVAPRRGFTEPTLAAESVMIAPWPVADAARRNERIEAQFAQFQAVLGAIREIRSRQNIPPREEIEFCVRCDEPTAVLLKPLSPYFASMAFARASGWGPHVTPPELCASVTLAGKEIHVDVSRFMDFGAEIARLEKELEGLQKRLQSIDAKLANENFVSRAPAEVVEQQRGLRAEVLQAKQSVEASLAVMRSRA
jgi:valyl-tRNA synthetase